MEIANVLVAIDGEKGHTVPRYGVTVAEVALLRAMHGEDAVLDIEVTGEVDRNSRTERQRLWDEYPKGRKLLDGLFPGAATPLFMSFVELELPDELYKATGRKTPTEPKPKKARAKVETAPEGGEPDNDFFK